MIRDMDANRAVTGLTAVLLCLGLLLAGCSSVNKSKFEGLNKATKSIQGALMSGVNYTKFGELLQNMGTELLLAKEKVSNDKEVELLNKYVEIFDVYRDSHALWGLKIRDILSYQEAKEYLEKYGITEREFAKYRLAGISPILQLVWEKASEKLEKLNPSK